MMNSKELKLDIFQLMQQVDDVQLLTKFRAQLQQLVAKKPKKKQTEKEKMPAFMAGVEAPSEHISFEEIMKEQGEKPTRTYAELRAIMSDIEWDESLEELLAAIK